MKIGVIGAGAVGLFFRFFITTQWPGTCTTCCAATLMLSAKTGSLFTPLTAIFT